MTLNIKARISALEIGQGETGVKVRSWLGLPLTDSDKAELAAMPDDGPYVRPAESELLDCSPQLRAWLLS
ncbi:hypothetical protein [Parasphingorhabdus flavimaris]|uniref:hypothetical protein n=1 Tax=Parasphingorhabdus flavimaris TaxID=266812 RepID=UPI0030014C6B